MSTRSAVLEFVRNDEIDQWYWRFIASNGHPLARSSETYPNRGDAERSARATLGIYHYPLTPFESGQLWRRDDGEVLIKVTNL